MDPVGVLFLTNSLPVGGFETHLLSIVREMDKESFRPVIACLKSGGPLESEFLDAGIPVHTRVQKWKLDPFGLLRLASIMRRENISVLDTDLQRNTVFLGALAADLAKVPVKVVSVHATARVGRSRLVEWPARISMGRIDRTVALASVHRDLLIHQEQLDPDRIVVLWNGVDVDAFSPGSPPGNLREALGIAEGSPVVAIVASLYPDKGHDVFLTAAARVVNKHPNAAFIVIGEGPDREKLEEMTKKKGLADAVHFLGRRRDLPDLLRLTDINVLSSYPFRETFPISILEAMACGNPTVTTRVGALSDIVAHQETGYLFDVGDADALAEALIRLLDDPELRTRMGRAARSRAEDLFSIQKTVRGREQFYRQLLAEKGGGSAT
ncbi:MAG: glycosyltransferase [Candidatus Eisenbacteria sp.]|nr:glycosyltransferase [Candidatus Eisenbacteria bacterium]